MQHNPCFGEKERRRNEGWRGWPRRRQQQVMDGVNAWIESQTVMHSYQLAVKREIDSRPERHGEREEEGWQEDREPVPDSSRPRCVHTQLFGWRWTVLSKAGLFFFFFLVAFIGSHHGLIPQINQTQKEFISRLQFHQPQAVVFFTFIHVFSSRSLRWVTAEKPLD